MAKDKSTPDAIETPENIETVEDVSAKADALAEQVAEQNLRIENLESENAALRTQIELLRSKTWEVANSVSINPAPPPALERPVVEIAGQRYQFKVGEVRLSNRDVRPAAVIAKDETLLAEIFEKYPGLFAEV